LPATYDEGTLERGLFPAVSPRAPALHLVPDWATVHHELKRKGVTLFLLWQEYKAATPDGLQYSWFWTCGRERVTRPHLMGASTGCFAVPDF
jgi:transposase